MKKKFFERTILGFSISIAIGQIINVLISLINGNGEFIICTPEFISLVGNVAYAAALQTLLCGIMGVGYASASLIWENDKLNLAAQTGICFGIYSIATFPIAYLTNWMEHSIAGILGYIGVFFCSFIFIWIAQYISLRIKLKAINANIHGNV